MDYLFTLVGITIVYAFVRNVSRLRSMHPSDVLLISSLSTAISTLLSVKLVNVLIEWFFSASFGQKLYSLIGIIVNIITAPVLVVFTYMIVLFIVNEITRFALSRVIPLEEVQQQPPLHPTPAPAPVPDNSGTRVRPAPVPEESVTTVTLKQQQQESASVIEHTRTEGAVSETLAVNEVNEKRTVRRGGEIVELQGGEESSVEELTTVDIVPIEEDREEKRVKPEIRLHQSEEVSPKRIRNLNDIYEALIDKMIEKGFPAHLLNVSNFYVAGEEELPSGDKKYLIRYVDITHNIAVSFECVLTTDGKLKIVNASY